jgi:RHS repeat-associated protein
MKTHKVFAGIGGVVISKWRLAAARRFAVSIAAVVLACLPARAQNCANWQGVSSWQGTISISGNGSGPDNEDGYNWTVSHAAQGPASLVASTTSACTWIGGTATGTGSFNDQGVSSEPCGNPGANTMSLVGSQFVVGGLTLTIDGTNNTYTLSPGPVVGGTLTAVCGSQQTTEPIDLFVGPFSSSCATLASVILPLPASVGVLQQTDMSFTGPADCNIDGGIPGINWTLSFTLTPSSATNTNQDGGCPKDGGSSIGCQNQSLGEDVPIVGTGFSLHYESDRALGTTGADSIATADAAMIGGWTLNVHHAYDSSTNTLFLGDGSQRSAWQLAGSSMYNGNFLVTSQDGSEVYVFSGTTGKHLQTLKPLTGALKYAFAYDAAGNLASVTDASGNITNIERNASEIPTAIVSPYSQTTTLSVDGNGFLSQVTDPLGNTALFTNSTADLLLSRTDPNKNVYTYAYNSQGKLTTDSDPVGGSTALSLTKSSTGYSVSTTTAMGVTSTFQVITPSSPGEQFVNTWPDGLQATATNTQQNGQLSESATLPDGTSNSSTLSADPRFGLQTPVLTSGTLTKGSLAETVAGSRTASFTSGNPFSLTAQTDTTTLNGRTYTSVFTTADRTYINTTPVLRTSTTVLDSLERISSTQLGALALVKFTYDSKGRLSTIKQSSRTTTLAYDSNGFLASSEDPLKLKTSFTHDAAGRLLTTTLPDGRVITKTYDANGNVTSVTPPGKSAHDFAYTPVDLISNYTPPVVSGTGATTYAYDLDRNLTTITRPDGETIKYGYDSAGRLSSTTTPTETVSYAYDSTAGNLSSASITGGEAIAYGYNGPLPTSSTWTGTVAGSVSRAYNNNFWVASQSINSGNTINFTYDKDGLITNAGTLVLKHNAKDGLITGTTLGHATDARSYDAFGEFTGLTAKYKTTALYAVKFTRDADGRITEKTETIGGQENVFTYTYDAAGRLIGVVENGTSISSYTYDTNSNRLTAITSSGTVNGTYDAQDRLLTYGTTSFTYTANGELASQAVGSQTTSYQYDVLGNLIAATLPNGTAITYIIDAASHRVGTVVNGVLQSGFLYDGSRIVAQLNGSNAIVSRFIYASGATAPDYMLSGGVTYRIFSDQLGSPRLVVNTSTGAITEQISYDEFGNVMSDTSPGFQPFGFAGGLYDQNTMLVRFGARDYTPAIGRWTAKDPISFAGGDTNLYGYVVTDPVNFTDATGLNPFKTISDLYNDLGDAINGLVTSAQDWYSRPIKPTCVCPQNSEGGNGITGGEMEQEAVQHTFIEGAPEVEVPVGGGETVPLLPESTSYAALAVQGAVGFAKGFFGIVTEVNHINCATQP